MRQARGAGKRAKDQGAAGKAGLGIGMGRGSVFGLTDNLRAAAAAASPLSARRSNVFS